VSIFQYAFVQRGLLEVGFLSVGLGLLGTWIVLRGLAFYAHAAGTAAFPGLVVADGLAFSAPLGAFAAALGFAAVVHLLDRRGRESYDALTALALVGSLALGVVLASDVFHSGSNVETLLFGSILLVGTRELALAGALSVVALTATAVLGRRWLASGFDPLSARAFGGRPAALDAVLLLLVAVGVVACLSALGALLVSSLLVVPAATARLFARRLRSLQIASVGLVALEGAAGLWLSVEANRSEGVV